MIYVDGSHQAPDVLSDAVVGFKLLKNNGIMIFDDYGWGGPDLTQRGIDGFMHGYHKRIQVMGEYCSQVFIRKIKSHEN